MVKILGAHDTLTGYRTWGVVSWLFKPMTKCQTKTIEELAEAGVTCYDLRVWMGKDGRWHYGHGVSEYDVCCPPLMLVCYIYNCHKMHNDKRVMFVRLLLERQGNDGRRRFVELCKQLEDTFRQQATDIVFIPARDKKTWEVLYDFGGTDDYVHEYHASVSGKGLLRYFPRLWNRRHGKEYQMQDGVNLVDFV